MTPAALAAELDGADDLTAAVARFADALALAPEQVVVRIQFRGCETCEIRMPPKQPPDLSLDEALTQIEPYDKFWLVARGVTCYLYFDGKQVTPLACQLEMMGQ